MGIIYVIRDENTETTVQNKKKIIHVLLLLLLLFFVFSERRNKIIGNTSATGMRAHGTCVEESGGADLSVTFRNHLTATIVCTH